MKTFPIEPKANCTKCGMSILLTTFERTEGRCMPCALAEGYVAPMPLRIAPKISGPGVAGFVKQAIYTIEEAMENRIAADAAPPTEEEELAEILDTPRVTAETPAPEPGSLLFCVMWERPKSWRPIGHLCLSETPLNLVLRLLSWQTKIPVQDMVSGRLSSNDFPGITRVACKLAKLPLFLAGREELARDGLVRTLRGWHDERGMRMLLIDSQAHSLAQFPDAIEELRSIEREASITVLFPDLVGLGELPVPEQSQRDTTPVVAGISEGSTATSGDLTEPF